MSIIFNGNVSKKGKRIVKAGRGREGKHTRAGHFVYSQHRHHFNGQK